MDESRLRFLFGTVPDAAPATEDHRIDLLDADRPGADDRELARRATVAGQILDGTLPDTWRTAQRLLDAGLTREQAMDQLVGAIVFEGEDADPVAILDRLPGPDVDALVRAYVELAREHGPLPIGELAVRMVARLGLHPDDAARLTDRAEEVLAEDPESPVALLSPDVVVHVAALTAGTVLTHRLTADERADDRLDLVADLAVLLPVTPKGMELDDPPAWLGPQGWLADHPVGSLLAVRVADGAVTLEPLADEPVPDPALLMLVRTAYDEETEESGLPLAAEDLVLAVLARERTAFDRPRPPLTELAAAAGLEHRDGEFAHEEGAWVRAEVFGAQLRLVERLGPDRTPAALETLELLADAAAGPAELRRALEVLSDPEVLLGVVEELAGDESPPRVAALVGIGQRLVAAAGSGGRAAVAEWVAAVAAERDGRVRDAEAHLRSASRAGRGWGFVEDRLAWYEYDRGDAAAALGRWSELDAPADDPDVAMARRFAAAAGPQPGRNAPCWCGSGRKYKQCHAGRPAAAPLPERVPWLCRKAVAYLERRGGTDADVYAYADIRSPDPDLAFADPLTLDVVLHEGGWFDRFLAERGPLLPGDEALLAASWALVERTVYEIVEVRAGAGVTVRDLATGDRLEVTERTSSREVEPGVLVCARAVPDGVGHQFVGGVFRVRPGHERIVLDIVGERDGEALLAWVAAGGMPPTLLSTDGDPVVICTATLRVPTGSAEALDGRYEPAEEGWVWFADTDDPDELRVLGALALAGDELTAHTQTEARMDRLLADLAALLPGSAVLSDERAPVDLDAAPPGEAPGPIDPADVRELQERMEQRWCSEPVPALDGHTPRDAVADPTRRDDVVRLIASFPEIDPATGAFGMRPWRLRELLDLP